MSKKPTPQEAEKTERVEKTLDGILGWVEKKKHEPKSRSAAQQPSKPWGWVVGIFASIMVFVALSFLAWRAWKKGREIAKLKHKMDVAQEEKRWLEIDKKLTQNAEMREELEKETADLQKRIDHSKNLIVELEKERKEAHSTIDKVSSWADVDRIISGK